ncbi:putative 5-formyltetrahydrofolate cyclo-ligase [Rhodobacteraceae bacterium THAF1]|uniref:5-formyltetrahydrofolate cyclo-ligase n=1 Tax=Palleronia sp. THAF1 TaxID=2587842 RepID=UPI000F410CE9|nr:5-formyltetrahydrofolate cyclo-ligase [Palleronia sp. THAF1]QFU07969.1 putative 5-formyltetrahydrofolate cyclo-ligase [Palleronia sp. THAF1]VDC27820.1 putative 5-formyltetrahydrofolate cyclo-ligase [Rhodobacteraceae bacterium THAF1]
MSLAADKALARKAALARRKVAHAAAGPGCADRLIEVLQGHRGRAVAGYAPIGTEIDPTPAMAAHDGPVCLPVIDGDGLPLRFRKWSPGCAMQAGAFGAMVPASGAWLVPDVLIVPLVAFDRSGGRLGYGGGFYDRTLAELRAAGPVTAIGFAYAAQEADALVQEATDAPLDQIVTEREVIVPG